MVAGWYMSELIRDWYVRMDMSLKVLAMVLGETEPGCSQSWHLCHAPLLIILVI